MNTLICSIDVNIAFKQKIWIYHSLLNLLGSYKTWVFMLFKRTNVNAGIGSFITLQVPYISALGFFALTLTSYSCTLISSLIQQWMRLIYSILFGCSIFSFKLINYQVIIFLLYSLLLLSSKYGSISWSLCPYCYSSFFLSQFLKGNNWLIKKRWFLLSTHDWPLLFPWYIAIFQSLILFFLEESLTPILCMVVLLKYLLVSAHRATKIIQIPKERLAGFTK